MAPGSSNGSWSHSPPAALAVGVLAGNTSGPARTGPADIDGSSAVTDPTPLVQDGLALLLVPAVPSAGTSESADASDSAGDDTALVDAVFADGWDGGLLA